ncbi:MAG: ABC transporter substrate-binding protein [Aestuariivirga sp.]
MNKRSLIRIAALAGVFLGALGHSATAEVILNHDKHFWSKQFQAWGDFCGEKQGIKIVQQPYSPPEQYKAFIQSSIASGSTPDMFTWWSGATFRDDLVATGQIAKMDDVWAELIKSGEFSEVSGEPFKVDGSYYAVPLHFNKWVMFYNPELFAKAGIAGTPKSWDELMAAAEKLKAAGITPFVATNQDGWRGFIWFEELMIRTNPKAYLGLFDGTVSYDGPEVKKAFDLWREMYAKGYFSDPRSNQEVADFAAGKGAMNLMGDWAIQLMTTAGMTIGKDLDAFVVPNMDASLPSGMIFEASPLVVSVAGKEKPDVMKALACWTSVDGANKWSEESGLLIGNNKVTKSNAILESVKAYSTENKSVNYTRWWEAVPPELQSESVAAMASFMLDPTEETQKKVMADIEALHKAYWAKKKQ